MFSSIYSTFIIVSGLIGAQIMMDGRTFSFTQMSIPTTLNPTGYNADLVKEKILLEAQDLVAHSQSRDQAVQFANTNTEGPPELIAKQLGIQPILDAAQHYVGRLKYSIIGAIVEHGDYLELMLITTRFDGRVVVARMQRPKADIDLLIKDGGYALIHLVAPHLACASQLLNARRRMQDTGSFDGSRTMDCISKAMPAALEEEKLWLLNLKAIVLAMREDRLGAYAALRTALRVEPNFSPALLNLGILLDRDGKPEEALKAYKAIFQRRLASDSAQTYSSAYALIALSMEKMGKKDDVVRYLWKAVRADPNFEVAQRLLLERLPEDSLDATILRNNLLALKMADGTERIYTENLLGFFHTDDLAP